MTSEVNISKILAKLPVFRFYTAYSREIYSLYSEQLRKVSSMDIHKIDPIPLILIPHIYGEFIQESITLSERIFLSYDSDNLRKVGIQDSSRICEHLRNIDFLIQRIIVSSKSRKSMTLEKDIKISKSEISDNKKIYLLKLV